MELGNAESDPQPEQLRPLNQEQTLRGSIPDSPSTAFGLGLRVFGVSGFCILGSRLRVQGLELAEYMGFEVLFFFALGFRL